MKCIYNLKVTSKWFHTLMICLLCKFDNCDLVTICGHSFHLKCLGDAYKFRLHLQGSECGQCLHLIDMYSDILCESNLPDFVNLRDDRVSMADVFKYQTMVWQMCSNMAVLKWFWIELATNTDIYTTNNKMRKIARSRFFMLQIWAIARSWKIWSNQAILLWSPIASTCWQILSLKEFSDI